MIRDDHQITVHPVDVRELKEAGYRVANEPVCSTPPEAITAPDPEDKPVIATKDLVGIPAQRSYVGGGRK